MSIEIVAGPLLIRSWKPDDAEALHHAILDNVEHLRPFLPWIAFEPLEVEARRELIEKWQGAAAAGAEDVVGVFLDGAVVGSSGLHARIGPGGLEVGYWIDQRFTRRGFATSVSRALTDHAFTRPDVDRVEIHHDRANVPSSGVPRTLGFALVGDEPREPLAPAETGVHLIWRVTRQEWTRRGGT